MNDQESFESELRRLKPAPPPPDLMARLAAGEQRNVRALGPEQSSSTPYTWRRLILRLGPALAAAVCILLIWRFTALQNHSTTVRVKSASKTEDIEIDHNLLGSFDAIGRMPGGEPVRFRCREWRDEVVLRDSARGIEVERRSPPRLEIIPVGFDIF